MENQNANIEQDNTPEDAEAVAPTNVSGRAGRRRKSASAFRTISEVADELKVQQHVLRFWETKFSQIKPLKRGGGRRYYRPEDLALLKRIHHLLYVQGFTIKGVQKLLREHGKQKVVEGVAQAGEVQRKVKPAIAAEPAAVEQDNTLTEGQRSLIESTLKDLKSLRSQVISH